MLKHPAITEDRIRKALPSIEALIYPQKAPVSIEAWHVGGEPVSLETALAASYQPFAVGGAWGPLWDTTWFRVRGEVPSSWKGEETVLLMRLTDQGREGFTAEGLVYANGNVVRALNANRREIEVSTAAQGGEAFEFYVEAAANFTDPGGNPAALAAGPIFRLAQAELASVNRAAFDYYYDFKIACELMSALPQDSQR
ncbi:MAG: hypothetical protein PHQ12_10245, partial [Chthoniobacteraceae bacterium]|nr:hypothetical protein [Chthoniobacteraceae bacterium]